jgi:hypothetical protein
MKYKILLILKFIKFGFTKKIENFDSENNGDAFGPAYRQASRALRYNSSFGAAGRSSASFRGFHYNLSRI